MEKKRRSTSEKEGPERKQREVLRDVMLSAGQCETWLTLRELALLTSYGEASISAQLRHLRKPGFGGFVVEKRRRESAEVARIFAGAVWEYRMSYASRAIRKSRQRVPVTGKVAIQAGLRSGERRRVVFGVGKSGMAGLKGRLLHVVVSEGDVCRFFGG
jgi:hypothetical protein